MNTPEAVVRSARWSELIFAIIALYLAASLPLRPQGDRGLWLMIHWYGMTVVAFWLVFALRRPSRARWLAAAALSAYFAVNCVIGVVVLRQGGAAAAYAGSAVALSYMIVGIALLAQLDVAFRCWRARQLWSRSAPGDIVAPVA